MDIGKALTFITEDPRWKEKIAIGTGVVILSTILSVVLIGLIGYFIALGYMVRLMQNVRDGHAHPLPEWDQWSPDLVRGLKLAVIILIWSLPAILFSIPVSLGGVLADGRGTGAFIGTTILFGGMCLVILYSLFLAVAQASFTIAFARDEQIRSGLQVREIWDWTQANIGQLVIVALAYIVVSIGISLVASIVGVLLCLIGLIVTLPLGQLVVYLFQFHLYGQLAAAHPYDGAPAMPQTPPPPTSPTAHDTTSDTSSNVTGSSFTDNPYAAYGPSATPPATETGAPASSTPADDTPSAETPDSASGPAAGSGIAQTDTGRDVTPETPSERKVDETYPDSGIDIATDTATDTGSDSQTGADDADEKPRS